MPAIARPFDRGIRPVVFTPQAPNAGWTIIPQVVPDLTEAAAAQGRAAGMGSIAEALQGLPQTVATGIKTGRQIREQGAGHRMKMDALEGKPTKALDGVRVGADGSITYDPLSPEEKALKEIQLKRYRNLVDADTETDNTWNPDGSSPALGGVGATDSTPVPGATAGLSEDFVSALKGWEGGGNTAVKDGIQFSNRYGVKSKPGETLTDEQADARLREELKEHAGYVDAAAKKLGKTLKPREREAYTSVSFNAGPDDMQRLMADPDPAKSLMGGFKTQDGPAGTEKGLRLRREKEAMWMGRGDGINGQTANADGLPPVPANAAAPGGALSQVALPSMQSKTPSGKAQLLQDTGNGKIYKVPGIGTVYRPNKVKKGDPGFKIIKGETLDTAEGRNFTNVAEAMAFAKQNGFSEPNIIPMPDGSVRVEKFVPAGQDEKSKGKITDQQKNAMMNTANLAADIGTLADQHAKLYNSNKAGPVMGRIQGALAGIGYGDPEYVTASGSIDVGKFKIARLLNGPGVLTDKDIQRAQSVAPGMNETPESFQAKIGTVKRMLGESIDSWLAGNEHVANPELVALAKRTQQDLGYQSKKPEAAAAATATPQASTGGIVEKRNALLQQILKNYQSGAYNADAAAKSRAEAALKQAGLL